MPRVVLSIAAFVLTLVAGLGFLDLVIDSHVYHKLIEEAFFGQKQKSVSADDLRANWHLSLKATDVRKIGHIIDSFEIASIAGLAEQIRDIGNIDDEDKRQRALVNFTARVETSRADLAHIRQELRALRDGGLEGVPVEFADIDLSLSRLRQATDVLAVVKAEVEAAPDQVTINGVKKQLTSVVEALKVRPRPDAVVAR